MPNLSPSSVKSNGIAVERYPPTWHGAHTPSQLLESSSAGRRPEELERREEVGGGRKLGGARREVRGEAEDWRAWISASSADAGGAAACAWGRGRRAGLSPDPAAAAAAEEVGWSPGCCRPSARSSSAREEEGGRRGGPRRWRIREGEEGAARVGRGGVGRREVCGRRAREQGRREGGVEGVDAEEEDSSVAHREGGAGWRHERGGV
ncbi:hypothetical protein PR202_gb11604 [Eleusine coracana subsp. coracana]|uniref:Uncharacterized protein n=1 Tax=Eleusine coracana subsp. coracana TaxID=191504 RepID=A0AAV5EM59_ELECO|nr:hypothetical protein PR202_gb11604 [Eleusine coracana subsp. coracana]